MKDLPLELSRRYNALNLRERLLVAGTILTITWAIWITSLGGAVIDSRAVVVNDIHRVEAELVAQHEERRRLLEADGGSRAEELGAERTRLTAELELTEAELEAALARFVAPEQIPGFLRDVIEAHDKLDLVRISSQPAETLSAGGESTLVIYRHPVQVEVKGSFMALLAYLEALETSDWGLSWRRLEYVVADYPDAHVLLEVETLSREKEWLGV